MNTLNKSLLMGGVAACAVALSSCGDKTDSATAPSVDEAVATATDVAKEVKDDVKAVVAEATTETVSINLSGLK